LGGDIDKSGLSIKGSEVQGSKVQGFKVQRFRGSRFKGLKPRLSGCGSTGGDSAQSLDVVTACLIEK
jgi:hypothetical protein